jgi:hypothetical protein
MAQKQTAATANSPLKSKTTKRAGIHSKKKASVHKKSKNYFKKYRGQGK